MRRIVSMLVVGGCILTMGVAQAEEELQKAMRDSVVVNVGDPAPVFQAVADDGRLWKSSEQVGKKTLVVYFFPAAMTGG